MARLSGRRAVIAEREERREMATLPVSRERERRKRMKLVFLRRSRMMTAEGKKMKADLSVSRHQIAIRTSENPLLTLSAFEAAPSQLSLS